MCPAICRPICQQGVISRPDVLQQHVAYCVPTLSKQCNGKEPPLYTDVKPF